VPTYRGGVRIFLGRLVLLLGVALVIATAWYGAVALFGEDDDLPDLPDLRPAPRSVVGDPLWSASHRSYVDAWPARHPERPVTRT
jgi:hypothetical protein